MKRIKALPKKVILVLDRVSKPVLYIGFALVAAGITYLFWLNHTDFEKAMVRQAQSQLLTIAKSQAQSTERYLVGVRRELEILATGYSVHKSLAEKNSRNINPQYYAYLRNSFKDVEKLVDTIYLIDAKGAILDASPDIKKDNVGKDVSQLSDVKFMLENRQAFTSDIFKTSSGQAAIASLYPVFEGNTFVGFLRAVILLERINELVNQTNPKIGVYEIMINDNGLLISYPNVKYVGEDPQAFLNNKFSNYDFSEFTALLERMKNDKEGNAVLPFLSEGTKPEIVKTLVAFVPVPLSNNRWSVAAAMDYSELSKLINKNTRDTLILMAVFILVCLTFTNILHKHKRKREELEVSSAATNIINKLLRHQVNEHRKQQKQVENIFHHKKRE